MCLEAVTWPGACCWFTCCGLLLGKVGVFTCNDSFDMFECFNIWIPLCLAGPSKHTSIPHRQSFCKTVTERLFLRCFLHRFDTAGPEEGAGERLWIELGADFTRARSGLSAQLTHKHILLADWNSVSHTPGSHSRLYVEHARRHLLLYGRLPIFFYLLLFSLRLLFALMSFILAVLQSCCAAVSNQKPSDGNSLTRLCVTCTPVAL